MGYLFLGISLLAGVTKGYCGKKTSGYVKGYGGALLANFIRMIFCIGIGALVIAAEANWGQMAPTRTLLVISAVSGLSTSAFVVFWLLSVRKGAYMMLDVFLMLGIFVPICGGSIFFKENIQGKHWVGFALLIAAAFVMCSYNNTVKEKMKPAALALLIACGAANGITDFMQKVFVKQLPEVPASVFNFYVYVFSAIVLGVFFAASYRREKANGNALETEAVKNMTGYIVVMSVCLFANSFFKTKAAVYLDSVQLYPLSQGLSLILSMGMAAVLFHEKINRKCIYGTVMAFISLLIINVL